MACKQGKVVSIGSVWVQEALTQGDDGPAAPFLRWATQAAEVPTGWQDPVAEAIKEQIWPNPLPFYTGKVEGLEEVGLMRTQLVYPERPHTACVGLDL